MLIHVFQLRRVATGSAIEGRYGSLSPLERCKENKEEKEMVNTVHDCLQQSDQLFQLNWMISNSTQTLSHGSHIAKAE